MNVQKLTRKFVELFQLTRGRFFFIIPSFLSLFLNFFITPYIIGAMSAEELADYGFFSNISIVLNPLFSLFFINYYISEFHRKNSFDLWEIEKSLILFSFVSGFIAFVVLSPLISYFYNFDKNKTSLLIMFLIGNIFTFTYLFLTVKQRFEGRGKDFLALSALRLFLLNIFYFIFIKLGQFSLIIRVSLPILFDLVITSYVVLKMERRAIRLDVIKTATKFTFYIVVTTFLSSYLLSSDLLYLKSGTSSLDYASYSLAFGFTSYFVVLPSLFLLIQEPSLSKAVVYFNSELIKRRFLLLHFILSFCFIIFYICADPLMNYFTKGLYPNVKDYFILHLVSKWFELSLNFIGFIIVVLNYNKLFFLGMLVCTLLSVFFYPLVIPKFSLNGALILKIIFLLILNLYGGVLIYHKRSPSSA
jgi:O-antigen/teichoic acid export membrane protein